MNWIAFKLYTTPLGTELLGGVFSSVGINELEIDSGREFAQNFLHDSETNWDFADIDEISPKNAPSITAYIANLPDNMGLVEKLKTRIIEFACENPEFDLGSLEIVTQEVDEEDWANNWKKYYKPLSIGENLLVCPTWEKVPDGNTRKVLMLDPGMAFGSGLHETTRMCLEAIESTLDANASVIDLGCGSGILSIAAQLLGAGTLVAVDVDPVCTEVARQNAALNGVALNTVTGNVINDEVFFESLIEKNGGKYDVVVANIVANVLIAITPRVCCLMKPNAVFISSGIITQRLDEVVECYEKNGLCVNTIKCMGEWTAVIACFK